MKKILAAGTALLFLIPASAAPPMQQLRPGEEVGEPGAPDPVKPPAGSAVLVPPLIVAGDTRPAGPMKVLRLPVQAGRVTEMIATNLVDNSKSWIAKGHKYYSLCVPDGSKISCAPIVTTATMKDIDVGAYADEKGSPKLSFSINPGTTQEPKRLIAAINYFLGRTATQTAHFNQKKSLHTPLEARPGSVAAPALEGGGDDGMVCTFNEFGGMDCTGGDGGAGGDGYDSEDEEDFDWEEEVEASEAALESLPGYPTGAGNGNPCIDSGGNDICGPQVVIIGRLPDPAQQAALPTCVATPWAIACSPRTPPVLIDPTEQLPRGPQPWLPQGACNAWGVLCSEGQVPEETPPPATTDEKRRRARMQCYAKANARLTACHDLRKNLGEDWFETCKRNAFDEGRECDLIGMDR